MLNSGWGVCYILENVSIVLKEIFRLHILHIKTMSLDVVISEKVYRLWHLFFGFFYEFVGRNHIIETVVSATAVSICKDNNKI